jgi:hypothetical protein
MGNVNASPATRKLYDSMLLVEACGASAELTAAINALGQLDAILHADAAELVALRRTIEEANRLRADLEALGRELLYRNIGTDIGRAEHDAYLDAAQRLRVVLDQTEKEKQQ